DRLRCAAMKRAAFLFLFLALTLQAAPPDPAAVAAKTRAWRAAHEREIIAEFAQLLAIPNLASDASNIERNAVAIAAMLDRRGVKPHIIREEGVPPLVVGDLAAPGAKQTIAFYAHYDGQPVDATQWSSPPWTPVLHDDDGRTIAIGNAGVS